MKKTALILSLLVAFSACKKEENKTDNTAQKDSTEQKTIEDEIKSVPAPPDLCYPHLKTLRTQRG